MPPRLLLLSVPALMLARNVAAQDERARLLFGVGLNDAAQHDPAISPLAFSGKEFGWTLGVLRSRPHRASEISIGVTSATLRSSSTNSADFPRSNRSEGHANAVSLWTVRAANDSSNRSIRVRAGIDVCGSYGQILHTRADPNNTNDQYTRWWALVGPAVQAERSVKRAVLEGGLAAPVLGLISWPYGNDRTAVYTSGGAETATPGRLRAIRSSLGVRGAYRGGVTWALRWQLSYLSWDRNDGVGVRKFATQGASLNLVMPLSRR